MYIILLIYRGQNDPTHKLWSKVVSDMIIIIIIYPPIVSTIQLIFSFFLSMSMGFLVEEKSAIVWRGLMVNPTN